MTTAPKSFPVTNTIKITRVAGKDPVPHRSVVASIVREVSSTVAVLVDRAEVSLSRVTGYEVGAYKAGYVTESAKANGYYKLSGYVTLR